MKRITLKLQEKDDMNKLYWMISTKHIITSSEYIQGILHMYGTHLILSEWEGYDLEYLKNTNDYGILHITQDLLNTIYDDLKDLNDDQYDEAIEFLKTLNEIQFEKGRAETHRDPNAIFLLWMEYDANINEKSYRVIKEFTRMFNADVRASMEDINFNDLYGICECIFNLNKSRSDGEIIPINPSYTSPAAISSSLKEICDDVRRRVVEQFEKFYRGDTDGDWMTTNHKSTHFYQFEECGYWFVDCAVEIKYDKIDYFNLNCKFCLCY